jgi:hypothetical protein
MAAYNSELDKILWKSDPILYKEGKTTLTVQIASYNGGVPKIYVREEGSHMAWQQDENGKNLAKEPKQMRFWGRPYLRRMEYNIISEILPDLIEGVSFLRDIVNEYYTEKDAEKEKKG